MILLLAISVVLTGQTVLNLDTVKRDTVPDTATVYCNRPMTQQAQAIHELDSIGIEQKTMNYRLERIKKKLEVIKQQKQPQ